LAFVTNQATSIWIAPRPIAAKVGSLEITTSAFPQLLFLAAFCRMWSTALEATQYHFAR
jgi:hypothetical protein